MKESRKVVLFLVEGITDETTFGLILSRIIEERKVVRFCIAGGDITSRNKINTSICINRVVDLVKEFLAQDIYQKSDLLEIIHLVDLDGTFVSEDHVIHEAGKLPPGHHIFYTPDNIITDNVAGIISRNQRKSEVLTKLSSTKEIFGKIPYQVYFFSCNLEHVFYDEPNPMDAGKYLMAQEIADRYVEDPQQFVQFFNTPGLAVSKEYTSSWSMIHQKEESLKRHSNFHLYLNQCKE